MERQRSFSSKRTIFMLFSFTITCSVILFSSSIWVSKSTRLLQVPLPRQFRKPALSLHLKQFDDAHNSTVLSKNHRGLGLQSNGSSIPTISQITIPENISGSAQISVTVELQREAMANGSGQARGDRPKQGNEALNASISNASTVTLRVSASAEKKRGRCDVTDGKWVFDESYPLYRSGSCPFIDVGFSCDGNGRLDRDYMKWRWQPKDCEIPRFNATKMLDLIRGKRLVFVGDSINRNQWESLLCMLMTAIKDPKRVYETHGRRITKEKGNYSFRFVDYKCTVEYYVTHFLVHESKTRLGRKRLPTLRIDAMDRGTSRWRGADIIVFNTAHWWSHYKTKAGINYYQEGNLLHPYLDVSTAFRRAMMTWASWVDKYMNRGSTQIFFRSLAPTHFRGGHWNSGGHCMEATQPLNDSLSFTFPEKNVIAEEVIRQMRAPVTFLNITLLSEYRIDGHPSMYGKKLGRNPPPGAQDCSHWCLPGVPDTWNELLYFYLQYEQKKRLAE